MSAAKLGHLNWAQHSQPARQDGAKVTEQRAQGNQMNTERVDSPKRKGCTEEVHHQQPRERNEPRGAHRRKRRDSYEYCNLDQVCTEKRLSLCPVYSQENRTQMVSLSCAKKDRKI